eukprot:5141307-Pyramimonas_sp.AAC.1
MITNKTNPLAPVNHYATTNKTDAIDLREAAPAPVMTVREGGSGAAVARWCARSSQSQRRARACAEPLEARC